MNQSSKTLLKKIASIRKANNVKAEDLAFLLDMPGETYKKLERGTGEVTLSQVFKIAEILKISAGSLFDEIEKTTEVNIPEGITEINFTVTIKSQNPINIESEIAKKFGMTKPTREDEILKRQGLTRRRNW